MSQSTMSAGRRQVLKSGVLLTGGLAAPWTWTSRAAAQDVAPLLPQNEKIQRSRDEAMAILKPSAQEYERGLRLHAESLVFESYGFAPRFAVDGDAFSAAINEGASTSELDDLREEMSMNRGSIHEGERREFLEAFRAAGVTCIFQNAGEEGNDPLRLLKRLARFTFLTDMLKPELFKAVRPEEIVAAKGDGRLCLYFSGNGVPLRQQWENTRDELRLIRIFFDLGIRMMHLTYNRRNPIGDGVGEATDGGLSDFGRQVVREMNRLGVIVDVAHSSWKTSLDAAKASTRPMVASHTTCTTLHHHVRSKPDGVIRAICDTGGLIGICCIPAFLGGAGDIGSMLDHICYAVKAFGAEHVAIGTDVAYISRNESAERNKIVSRQNTAPERTRWEALWPPGSLPSGLNESLAWTNWPLFTVGMVQRGIKDDEIRKILGENVLRVARENFPPPDQSH